MIWLMSPMSVEPIRWFGRGSSTTRSVARRCFAKTSAIDHVRHHVGVAARLGPLQRRARRQRPGLGRLADHLDQPPLVGAVSRPDAEASRRPVRDDVHRLAAVRDDAVDPGIVAHVQAPRVHADERLDHRLQGVDAQVRAHRPRGPPDRGTRPPPGCSPASRASPCWSGMGAACRPGPRPRRRRPRPAGSCRRRPPRPASRRPAACPGTAPRPARSPGRPRARWWRSRCGRSRARSPAARRTRPGSRWSARARRRCTRPGRRSAARPRPARR